VTVLPSVPRSFSLEQLSVYRQWENICIFPSTIGTQASPWQTQRSVQSTDLVNQFCLVSTCTFIICIEGSVLRNKLNKIDVYTSIILWISKDAYQVTARVLCNLSKPFCWSNSSTHLFKSHTKNTRKTFTSFPWLLKFSVLKNLQSYTKFQSTSRCEATPSLSSHARVLTSVTVSGMSQTTPVQYMY